MYWILIANRISLIDYLQCLQIICVQFCRAHIYLSFVINIFDFRVTFDIVIYSLFEWWDNVILWWDFIMQILWWNFYDFEDVSVKCLFWDDRKVRNVLILLAILGFWWLKIWLVKWYFGWIFTLLYWRYWVSSKKARFYKGFLIIGM